MLTKENSTTDNNRISGGRKRTRYTYLVIRWRSLIEPKAHPDFLLSMLPSSHFRVKQGQAMPISFFTLVSHLPGGNSYPVASRRYDSGCHLLPVRQFWQLAGLGEMSLWLICQQSEGTESIHGFQSKLFKAKWRVWVKFWACLRLPHRFSDLSAQQGSLLMSPGENEPCRKTVLTKSMSSQKAL